ncbi:MAG: DUF2961 domain-containing protein [Verrucomicrobia bacterium]|nr:DUF2961 domain-containing protein [Verrucomicrobiota bacterium]
MKTDCIRNCIVVLTWLCVGWAPHEGRGGEGAQTASPSRDATLEITVLKPAMPSGSVSAFWNVDRQYLNQPALTPRSRVTVADLKGPGVITLLRFADVPGIARARLLRGIVVEIYFDDASEPAVLCPLPDFFGDGANGKSVEFASRFVEKVPVAWNAYFPMPFKTSAKVIFRNDTDVNTMAYMYLEWEKSPEWNPALGYFHATYRRKGFVLSNDSREEFLRVQGRGHFLGRQFTIASDQPRYAGFNFIMEGNNEVDVDGRRRAFDYLGSEDSFTFSWGFNRTWTGPHAGMTHILTRGPTSRLSIYRFHDHMPIRFDRELVWTIDWRSEDVGFGKQRGWVDYATVFYWYQDSPGGFRHEPLPPVAERCLDILASPEPTTNLLAGFEKLPLDQQLANTFDSSNDLQRVALLNMYPKTHPFWIDEPQPRGGHPGQPNLGKRGILAVHAEDADTPAIMLRKVTVPAGNPVLRLVVSGDPYEIPGKSDFLLQAGVLVEGRLDWFALETFDAGSPPASTNWKTFEYPLRAYAGKTVGVVVKVAYGGPNGVFNEEAFFDEISVIER